MIIKSQKEHSADIRRGDLSGYPWWTPADWERYQQNITANWNRIEAKVEAARREMSPNAPTMYERWLTKEQARVLALRQEAQLVQRHSYFSQLLRILRCADL